VCLFLSATFDVFIVSVISEDGCKYLIRCVVTRVSQQKHQFTRSSRHIFHEVLLHPPAAKKKLGFEYAFLFPNEFYAILHTSLISIILYGNKILILETKHVGELISRRILILILLMWRIG
jgi:hypothetical protein